MLARTPAATPAGAPVAAIHDAIARPVYGAVRGLGGAIGRAAGVAAGLSRPAAAAPLADSARGAAALGALAGAAGTGWSASAARSRVRMALCRGDGQAVALEPAALAADVPDATPRLAVFVHGLGETARTWAPPEGRPGYGERLQADLGITPLWLRFNSGLPVAENGRRLSALLEDDGRRVAGRARGDRADRPLDGRARRPQRRARGPPQRRGLAPRAAPRGLPGQPAPRCPGREGGPPGCPRARGRARVAPVRHDRGAAQRRDPRPPPRPDGRSRVRRDRRLLGPQRHRDPRPAPPARPPRRRRARAPGERDRPGRALPPRGVVHAGGLHHFAVLDSPAVYAALRARLGVTRPAPAARRRAGSGGSRGSRRAGRARS